MFVTTAYRYPATGKTDELRGILVELVHYGHAQGIPAALYERLFRPEGALFVVAVRYDRLEQRPALLERLAGDDTYRAYISRIVPLQGRPEGVDLWESVVPPATRMTDTQLLRRGFFFPATGRSLEVRRHLEGFVRQRQAEGAAGISLSVARLHPEGVCYALNISYRAWDDLAAAWADPSASGAATLAIVEPLCRTPWIQTVARVLIPFPPQP